MIGSRAKRDLFSKISKTAQLLYGLYNSECISKSDNNINKEMKTNKYKLGNDMLEISTNLQKHSIITKYFYALNLLITRQIFETNTPIDIIQAAKIRQIHPSCKPNTI